MKSFKQEIENWAGSQSKTIPFVWSSNAAGVSVRYQQVAAALQLRFKIITFPRMPQGRGGGASPAHTCKEFRLETEGSRREDKVTECCSNQQNQTGTDSLNRAEVDSTEVERSDPDSAGFYWIYLKGSD